MIYRGKILTYMNWSFDNLSLGVLIVRTVCYFFRGKINKWENDNLVFTNSKKYSKVKEQI